MDLSKSLLGIWGCWVTFIEGFAVCFWKALYDKLVIRGFDTDVSWALFLLQAYLKSVVGKTAKMKWGWGEVVCRRSCWRQRCHHGRSVCVCVFPFSLFLHPSMGGQAAMRTACGQGKYKIHACSVPCSILFSIFTESFLNFAVCYSIFRRLPFFFNGDLGERGCTL